MTVLAPPEPRHDEIELLIREARARRRRRLSLIAAGVLAAAGVGLAILAVRSGGGGVAAAHVSGRGAGAVNRSGSALSGRRGIGDVGSAGGVTWAINGRGFWLTTNGGRTWRQSRLPNLGRGGVARGRSDPIANISGVQFVDRRDGWVSAANHSVYRTSDGGRSWQASTVPGGGFIDFLDRRHGYALGPDGLFRTADGGKTWLFVSKHSMHGPITFLDRRTGFAFEDRTGSIIGPYQGPEFGYLYKTTDGGRTWSRYDIRGSARFVEQPIAAFGRELVLAQNGPNRDGGINLAPATVYRSRDGGRSWSGARVPNGVGVPAPLSAASPRVWVWASRRDLFATRDAGRSWHKIVLRNLSQTARIGKVDFTSRRVGWAVVYGLGTDGTLLRTTDGGIHWNPAGPLRHRTSRR
ncbi:MAG TPA: YCF48-related protein [Gaiellaceae bacterium]|nr:YCF48-related protein [Gaiellaceae bacterium]